MLIVSSVQGLKLEIYGIYGIFYEAKSRGMIEVLQTLVHKVFMLKLIYKAYGKSFKKRPGCLKIFRVSII